MKKYMIRTDIEGVTGVVSYEQSVPGKSEYEEGRRLFMGDLLALIDGLMDGGADEIYLYDEHCSGRNIVIEELPENVHTYAGKPLYTASWAGGLDSSFDGLILLGFHSKADGGERLLNHSYESDIQNIDVNGISLGEIGIESAIAGELGVPLLMITGDSEGVHEALQLVPEAIGVSVKESINLFGALCYPPKMTRRWIRDGAKRVAEGEVRPSVFEIKGPITLRVDLYPGAFATAYESKYGQAIYCGDTVLECWAAYQRDRATIL